MTDNHVCGVHRGKVLAALDSGVLRVQVPTLFGMTSVEAQPCREVLAVPDVGDGVWLAFEAGDIEHPVWLGVWQ